MRCRSDASPFATCPALENRVKLSPTREKLKERVGLKGATDFSISLNSNYWMLICTITHIFTINLNNTHVTSRCVGPRGAATWP